MKRLNALLIVIVFLNASLWRSAAADELIRGKYCYSWGDRESLEDARKTTRDLAVRNALESCRVYVDIASKVNNFSLSHDTVRTLSAGFIKDLVVLSHSEIGRTICDDITATVKPDAIEAMIRGEISRDTAREDDRTFIEENSCMQILRAEEAVCRTDADPGRCIKVVVKAIRPSTFCDQSLKKLHVVYSDKNGQVIGSIDKEITYREEGEVNMVELRGRELPLDARSFRVNLKQFVMLEVE